MFNKLDVQEFLETKSFGDLFKEWGINARVSSFGHKFSLKYDQLAWKPGHVPSEQCRGLILARVDRTSIPFQSNGRPDLNFVPGKTQIFAYPMNKFYNSVETQAPQINWNDKNLVVEDKLDGTLIILYFDPVLGWCVATGSVPDADLPVDGCEQKTFRKLFEDTLKASTGLTFLDFCKDLPKNITFCFELTGPFNRIVVEYKHRGVTFLFARDVTTLLEVDRDELRRKFESLSKVQMPKRFDISSFSQLNTFVKSKPPCEFEGCILYGDFGRVKVKSEDWTRASRIKDTVSSSPRNLVSFILQGTDDDIKALFPEEVRKSIDDLRDQINNLFNQFDENFAKWNELATSRKNFAEFVGTFEGWKGPYFMLYEKKYSSVRNFVSSLLINNKLKNAFIDGILMHVKVRTYASFNEEIVSD